MALTRIVSPLVRNYYFLSTAIRESSTLNLNSYVNTVMMARNQGCQSHMLLVTVSSLKDC